MVHTGVDLTKALPADVKSSRAMEPFHSLSGVSDHYARSAGGLVMAPTAIAYIRVSTEEQAREGVSLAAQEERIRAYCALAGLDLVQVVRDAGVSGSKPFRTRPGGEVVLRELKKRGIKNVVVVKLDRLFRDAADALEQTREWDERGVALHLLDFGGQTLSTGSAMGRLFLTLTAAFAELERNLIRERTTVALQHKKRQGEVYGPVPFGLDRVGDALKPNRREQQALRKMREWRATGMTMREIASRLTASGVRTKRGGRWDCGTVSYILRHAG